MSKKLRNRFLALGCLVAFIALGLLFYVNWVVQKPFAVIVFLTDNLTASNLTAARMYQGGADYRLALERLPNLALLTTHANDFAVSDTGAATTAIATGQKVNNRSVGVDSGGKPLPTLFDLARKHGRAIGLVSNASLTDTTPAAFYGKTTDPHDSDGLAVQLAEQGNLDVILGGGEGDFLPELKEGRRKDGRDLMLEIRHRGYDIVRNKSELINTPLWRAPKLFGIFAAGDLAYADEIKSAGSQPSLADMVSQAIQLLQYNRKGYLLVVDAGLVGKAASQNAGERTLQELIQLDRAVAAAVTYAGEKNSLIIVAGKQSVGGLRLNGYPFRNDKGVAILGVNSQGTPSITWSTGPGSRMQSSSNGVPDEPSAFPTPAAVGTAEDTISVSTGPGSEKLQSFKDNTDIFRVVSENL